MLYHFTYPKIQSPFKRDKKKNFLPGVSNLAFAYLLENSWRIYEKLDGISVRVIWDSKETTLTFAGRSDNTQFTKAQLEYLNTTFKISQFLNYDSMVFFGELVGPTCHKNRYNLDSPKFIAFDMYRWDTACWQSRDFLISFSNELGVEYAPFLGICSLKHAIDTTVDKPPKRSVIYPSCDMEGIVLHPTIPLFLYNNERVVTKLKFSDKWSI